MNDILAYISLALQIIAIIVLIVLLVKISYLGKQNDTHELKEDIEKDLRDIEDGIEKDLRDIEQAIESDLTNNRLEINSRLDSMSRNINSNMNDQIEKITNDNEKHIYNMNQNIRDRLDDFSRNLTDSTQGLDKRMAELQNSQEQRLDKVTKATSEQLEKIRESNQQKLDEIENVVSEKLDKNLTDKVNQSFEAVTQRLHEVYQKLGEMKGLADDVGTLKTALTNVKVRGEIGEVQLARILEQTLTKEQYDENVITKPSSKDAVEFAVKIPSKEAENQYIYLPIDAKFPLDKYSKLVEAYDKAIKEEIDAARKELKNQIIKDAKNIKDKYISVPETTDFAILFLPTEGLFSEVIRDVKLTEDLRNNYKITICGPSTITAFLNSLQMGFRTLTYEKKSAQIAQTLSAVKSEFNKFADSLEKVQAKLDETQKQLTATVGTRTNKMRIRLRDVADYDGDSAKYLDLDD